MSWPMMKQQLENGISLKEFLTVYGECEVHLRGYYKGQFYYRAPIVLNNHGVGEIKVLESPFTREALYRHKAQAVTLVKDLCCVRAAWLDNHLLGSWDEEGILETGEDLPYSDKCWTPEFEARKHTWHFG